jgi:hypothetical protein
MHSVLRRRAADTSSRRNRVDCIVAQAFALHLAGDDAKNRSFAFSEHHSHFGRHAA